MLGKEIEQCLNNFTEICKRIEPLVPILEALCPDNSKSLFVKIKEEKEIRTEEHATLSAVFIEHDISENVFSEKDRLMIAAQREIHTMKACLQQALEREAKLKEIIEQRDAAIKQRDEAIDAYTTLDESTCLYTSKYNVRCTAARYDDGNGGRKLAYCGFKHATLHFKEAGGESSEA